MAVMNKKLLRNQILSLEIRISWPGHTFVGKTYVFCVLELRGSYCVWDMEEFECHSVSLGDMSEEVCEEAVPFGPAGKSKIKMVFIFRHQNCDLNFKKKDISAQMCCTML